jgi:hypothetical protein
VRWLIWLAVLAGCDGLLGLHKLDRFGDAAPDSFVMHDEDHDNIDNTLDNCPGIYNPLQEDGDHDGVGDVCDPHPSVPGDHIAVTEFFDGPFVALGGTPADWTIADGVQTTNETDLANAMLMLTRSAHAPTLELQFVVVDYGPDTTVRNEVNITIAFPNNTAQCELTGDTPGAYLGDLVTFLDNSNTGFDRFATLVQPGEHTRITMTREPQGHCTSNGVQVVVEAGVAGTLDPVTISLVFQHMKVAVEYVIVYDVP